LVILALLVSIPFVILYPSLSTDQLRFTWIYTVLVVDETVILLSVVISLIPLFNRRFGSVLKRKFEPTWPVKVLAILGLVVGLLLFGFWVMVDILGSYGGPGYTWSTYPSVAAIYNSIWLFQGYDRMGQEGFLSFCVAVLSFMVLRAKRGIGVAVKDGVIFLAAPIIIVFELMLWTYIPLDMYWKVTGFTSWSLGTYLTAGEFASMTNTSLILAWAGNVYLLSNWFVLLASSSLLVLGISTRQTHTGMFSKRRKRG